MGLNWNLKKWGIIALVVWMLFTSGAYLATIENEKESVSILTRVNNDGSGIFLRSDVYDERQITIEDPEGWDGLVFMTPGPSSIQHMILSDIVKDKLGMNFIQRGTPSPGNAVSWTQMAPGNMVNYMFNSPEGRDIDGGIAWEPHYAVAISGGKCKEVAETSSYWEGHPCCVVAASNTFLSNNEGAVQRFLAGYIKSVEWINDVLSGDTGDEDYEWLLEKVIDIGTPKTTGSAQMSEDTAISALENIQFAYEISNLAEQLAEVVETYKTLGIVNQQTLTDAGFETPLAFTEHLIQGQHLEGASHENNTLKSPEELGYHGTGMTTIDVAYLAADIHQIALHVGIAKGFYEEYGIHIRLNGPYGAGGDVMNALLSRHSDLGFVGSPPVVSSSANALRS